MLKSIIEELEEAKNELYQADLMINCCDGEFLESAIYKRLAAELRLNVLCAIAKRQGVRAW
mgnify:CR=1 FL=1